MGTRRTTALGLCVVAVVSSCSGAAGLQDKARSVGRQRAEQASHLAHEAGLGDSVAAFLSIAAGAAGHAFTIEYDTGGGRLTVWQDPPRRRVDVTGGELGPIVRTSLVNDVGAFSCERRPDHAACLPSNDAAPAVTPFAATDLERTISSLSTAKLSYAITVESRDLVGVRATCLLTVRRPEAAADAALGERGEMCVAPATGAPLLVDQPGQHLAATAYQVGVRANSFVLPAPLDTSTTAAKASPSTTR